MAKTKTSDARTLELMQAVANQEAEISKVERPNYITNCSFSYTEKMNDSINIHVESSVQKLICIVAFLRDKEKAYDEAANVLAVANVPEFTWGGYAVSDWTEDIKTRIGKIQIASKKKKLEVLKARLKAIVSPELNAQMELEAIENELDL